MINAHDVTGEEFEEKENLQVNRVLVRIARKTEGAVQPSKYLLYCFYSLSYPGLS